MDTQTKNAVVIIAVVAFALISVISSTYMINRKVFRNADDEVKVIQAKEVVNAAERQSCGDVGGVWKGYYCDYPDAK